MKYNFKKEFGATFEILANALSVILLVVVLLSFLARYHWLADIFSHFLIQYIIGALALAAFYILIRKRNMVIALSFVLIISMAELRLPISASGPDGEAEFSIMQYNRLVTQMKHEDLMEYLRDVSADVVVLQEAGPGMNKVISSVKDTYPYYINQTRIHAFGMVLLSRYPILNQELISAKSSLLNNFILHAEIDLPDNDKSLIVYALHSLPPTSHEAWRERNTELHLMSEKVKKDNNDYVVMIGDWNITPYSPFFKDILKVSGLHHADTEIFPPATWPSVFRWPIFQVTIDHVLFSPSLQLIEKKAGPAMGSDHYPLMATFRLREQKTASSDR